MSIPPSTRCIQTSDSGILSGVWGSPRLPRLTRESERYPRGVSGHYGRDLQSLLSRNRPRKERAVNFSSDGEFRRSHLFRCQPIGATGGAELSREVTFPEETLLWVKIPRRRAKSDERWRNQRYQATTRLRSHLAGKSAGCSEPGGTETATRSIG